MLHEEYLKQHINVIYTTFAISCAWAEYIFIRHLLLYLHSYIISLISIRITFYLIKRGFAMRDSIRMKLRINAKRF